GHSASRTGTARQKWPHSCAGVNRGNEIHRRYLSVERPRTDRARAPRGSFSSTWRSHQGHHRDARHPSHLAIGCGISTQRRVALIQIEERCLPSSRAPREQLTPIDSPDLLEKCTPPHDYVELSRRILC